MANQQNTATSVQDQGSNPLLSLSKADIKTMSLESGTLVLTKSDGTVLVIENFSKMADAGSQIQLKDGTLDARQLMADLGGAAQPAAALAAIADPNVAANDPAVIHIAKPAAGQTATYELQSGGRYAIDFNMAQGAKVSTKDGALIITFDDNGQIVLKNFAEAMDSATPPDMLYSGREVSFDEFLASLRVANLFEEKQAEKAQDVAMAEQLAEQLAAIEPAAGEAGGGAAGRGYGFQSSVDAAPFASIDATGPLGNTDLFPDLPEFTDEADLLFTAAAPAAAAIPGPAINVADQVVTEDGTMNFIFSVDTNGGPNTQSTIVLSGLPKNGDGWTVDPNGGTYDPVAGTWTVVLPPGTTTFSGGPILSPPANSDVDNPNVTVTVNNVDTVTGDTQTASETVDVLVDAVGDNPNLFATTNPVNEDTPAPLNIATSLTDTDGSEEIVGIYVHNVPAGFTLSAGTNLGGGKWQLTPAQLPGLQVNPSPNFNGTVALRIESVTEEVHLSDNEADLSNNTGQSFFDITLTFNPGADNPTLLVNGGAPNATVLEDGSVSVPLQGTLDPAGSGNETLTATITGIPATWGFTAPIGTYNAATGTWTVTLPAGTNLNTAVVFSPPADSDVDLSGLTVTLTATEPSNGSTATVSQPFGVIVDAVADAPLVGADDATGDEGTAISLTVTADVADTDGSEVIEYVRISGMPAGSSLNAGSEVTPGTWQVSRAQLTGLKINVPSGSQGVYTLTVEGGSFEQNTSGTEPNTGNNRATATDTLTLTVNNDDSPVIVTPPAISADESNLTPGGLTVNGGMTIDYGADAAGSIVANGNFNTNGLKSKGNAISVTLAGDTYTGTANGVTVFTLKLNNDGTYTYKQFAAVDHPNINNLNDNVPVQFGFTVTDDDGDATDGFITVNILDDGPFAPDYLAPVDETTLSSGPISVTRSLPNLSFGADGGGSLTPTGTFQAVVATDGTVTNLTSGGQPVVVTIDGNGYVGKVGATTIFTLEVNPNTGEHTYKQFAGIDHPDAANGDDSLWLKFQMRATDSEGDRRTFFIGVDVRDDGPTANDDSQHIDTSIGHVSGNVIAGVGAGGADKSGADANASVSQVVVNGVPHAVPAGGSATITGTHGTLVIASDGSYTYTLSNPATNNTDTFTYTLRDGDGDTDTATLSFDASNDIVVTSTANGGANTATVNEDTSVTIPVSAGYTGGDGDEVMTIKVTGIGAGWTVTAPAGWVNSGGGVYTLTLPAGTRTYTGNITFQPPANSDVDLNTLVLETSVADPDTGSTKTATDGFSIIVDAVADAPTVNAADVTGEEGTAIALNIAAALADTDGSEVIEYVRISNMPAGSTLTAGSQVSPGVWQVTQAQLAGLKINVPDGAQGTYTLSVEAIAFEQNTSGSEPDTADNRAGATDTFVLTVDDDDVPVITTPESIAVDESNLGVAGLTVNDSIAVTYGADSAGSFTLNNNVITNGLKSKGNTIAVTLAGDTYTGTANGVTVFTLKLNANGTYTYKQFAAVDHPNINNLNDSVPVQFGFTVTDNDGDATNDFITVNILDDGPFSPDYLSPVDEDSLASGPISVTRTLPNLNYGFDGAGSLVPTGTFQAVVATDGTVTNLTSGGQPVVVTVNGNGYVGKVGATTIFSIDVNPLTGEHTYQQFANLDHPDTTASNESLWLKFQMRVTDSEGDKRTFFIGIDVMDNNDGQPVVSPVITTPENITVDESFLVPGGLTVNDSIDVNYGGDAPGGFTLNGNVMLNGLKSKGHTVAITTSGDTYTGTANGVTVFTLKLNANGTYTYKQFAAVDHPNINNLNDSVPVQFGFTVTDGDGDATDAFITVNMLDDGPFSPDYLAPVDEDSLTAGPISVTRSLPNFTFGADGGGSLVPTGTFQAVIATDGTVTNLTSNGQAVVVTVSGNGYVGKVGASVVFSLDVDPNTGEHTYKQFAALDHPDTTQADESLWLKFQMRATDAEGDKRSFFIGVDVHDNNDSGAGPAPIGPPAAANIITGTDGDDVLFATSSHDIFEGKDGADLFTFQALDKSNDRIEDFNLAEGDSLDLSQLLQDYGYDPLQDSINDFVYVNTSGADTVVSFDVTGSGHADRAVPIITLQGVTGVTVDDIVADVP